MEVDLRCSAARFERGMNMHRPGRNRYVCPLAGWYNLSYTVGMKTAISIPDSIFQAADALAKQLGISRSELYSTAVAEYLSRRHGEQITARLDAVHGQEDARVEPALGQLQARGLPREALW